MNKNLIESYKFNQYIEKELDSIYEEAHIYPGRKYMRSLKKEIRNKYYMKHTNHKRHFESHAEEQKRLAKNAGYFYAYTYWDEDKHYYKYCRGHGNGKKVYRTYAARMVRREYNSTRTEQPMKNEIPLNGNGYRKYFELWYTLD